MNDVIHPLSDTQTNTMNTKQLVIGFIAVIIVGLAVGFALSRFSKGPSMSAQNGTSQDTTGTSNMKSAGVKDKSIFKDTTKGILKAGGIEGESDYHLERPGGESQNVYLTSSTVDLSQFLNKKVEVWGQTINSDKAGWFMDVGALEVQ